MVTEAKTHRLIEDRWDKIRSELRARWSELTDEDLSEIDGDSRKLVALVSQKTNMPISQIEAAIDEIAAGSGGLLSRVVHSAGSMAKMATGSITRPVGRAYRSAHDTAAARPGSAIAGAFICGLIVGVCYACGTMKRDSAWRPWR